MAVESRPAIERAHLPCGTRAAYIRGCRCLPCRAANANYQTAREGRKRSAAPWVLGYSRRARYWLVRHAGTGEVALRTPDRAEAGRRRDELNGAKMERGEC